MTKLNEFYVTDITVKKECLRTDYNWLSLYANISLDLITPCEPEAIQTKLTIRTPHRLRAEDAMYNPWIPLKSHYSIGQSTTRTWCIRFLTPMPKGCQLGIVMPKTAAADLPLSGSGNVSGNNTAWVTVTGATRRAVAGATGATTGIITGAIGATGAAGASDRTGFDSGYHHILLDTLRCCIHTQIPDIPMFPTDLWNVMNIVRHHQISNWSTIQENTTWSFIADLEKNTISVCIPSYPPLRDHIVTLFDPKWNPSLSWIKVADWYPCFKVDATAAGQLLIYSKDSIGMSIL